MKTRLLIAILVLSMFVSSNPIAGGSYDEYSLGKVEWQYNCHPLVFNTGMVRVIDPDMNLDDNTPDSFDIEIYSDYDEGDIQKYVNPIHTVVETDNSTGVFEGMIFWGDPHDEGIGHRVPIWDNVTVTAKYTDYTLPSSYGTSEINITSSIIVNDVKPIKQKRFDDGVFYYIYEPCTIELLDMKKNPHSDVHEFIFPPPSQQLESGLSMEQLRCKENLVLIQKYDGTPACVTESTKQKLIDRGWTSSTTVTIYSNFEQNRDRTYTNPRNVMINLEKTNSISWINTADYTVQVYDYENKSWTTGKIIPSMSESIRFNNTGYHEFAVESANDRHFGKVVVISDNTNSLPIETRMKMGMAIVSNDLGKNPALVGVGTGDVNDGVKIDINQKELEKRDDAESYYYDMYKEMIPFDVPITIEFGTPPKLLE